MKHKHKAFTLVEVMIVIVILGLLLALIISIAGFPGGINRDFAEGSRIGVVTKISRKGVIWKSWEAEMLVGGMRKSGNDAAVNVLEFNVSPDLVEGVTAAMEHGNQVEVKYRQWWIKPFSISNTHVAVEVRDR